MQLDKVTLTVFGVLSICAIGVVILSNSSSETSTESAGGTSVTQSKPLSVPTTPSV